ncbi:hypothetical protein P0D75_43925 [Paraburkholderia sediminicola]|uniref:hypothetical protein n=1 Tax=Paraburkholderia sediminicola TaxID=458836 RepID=UPI001414DDD0
MTSETRVVTWLVRRIQQLINRNVHRLAEIGDAIYCAAKCASNPDNAERVVVAR